MKRFLVSILILALTAGLLAGCTKPADPATEPLDKTTSIEETTKPIGTDTEETKETTSEGQQEDPSEETTTEAPTVDIARIPHWEMPTERLFTIALYPDVDRDFVIQRVLEKYNVVLLLEWLAPKSFAIYTKDLLSDEEAWNFMTEIALEGGVLSVSRPQSELEPGKNQKTFPGQKITFYKYGPEMMPAGGWDLNDPESLGKENPWTKHTTLSEAEKAAGFTFEIPENDLQKIYRTMGQEIIEVIFLENGEEVYRLRKGVGYGNVSGDNRKFSGKGAGNLGGLNIFTYYGSMEEDPFETYRLAYRIYTDYSYSASLTKPMTGDEIVKLFPDDKHTRSEEDEIPNSRDVEWYLENYKEGVTVLELPEEVMTRPPLEFPRQGENGREYSPETLIVKLDLTYNKETVIQNILSRFPVELKYEFKLADSVIALRTTETLDDEALAELAEAIYAMTGVQDVTRDPINQLDVVHETTVLSDI